MDNNRDYAMERSNDEEFDGNSSFAYFDRSGSILYL